MRVKHLNNNDMNGLEDLLLGIDCDDFISSSLMYQKVDWVEYGSLVDNGDGTYSQHYMDKVEPIVVSSGIDSHIYRALKAIERDFNTKL
jgi:hypothetical protein